MTIEHHEGEITPTTTSRPGEVLFYDPKVGSFVVERRWSWRWVLAKIWLRLATAVAHVREWRYIWYGFKVGFAHGRATLCRGPIQLRFDPVRGEHWYCNGCLRPIDNDDAPE